MNMEELLSALNEIKSRVPEAVDAPISLDLPGPQEMDTRGGTPYIAEVRAEVSVSAEGTDTRIKLVVDLK